MATKKKVSKKLVKVGVDGVPYDHQIPNNELLTLACEYNVGPEPIVNGRVFWWLKYPSDVKRYNVTVRNMGPAQDKKGNPVGEDRWGIFREGNSSCLNKLGEWEYQPMPSSRTDDFYKRCRYASVHEAINYYKRWKFVVEEYAKKKLISSKDDNVIVNYDEVPAKARKF